MHIHSALFVLMSVWVLHHATGNPTNQKSPLSSSSKGQLLNRTLEYLKLTDAEAMYDLAFKMQMGAFGDMFEPYQAEVKQILDECCSYAAMKQELAQIYMKEFTLNDMNGIVRFYSSSFGRKLVKKQPILIAKSKELGERKAKEYLPKLQAMIQNKVTKDMTHNGE